MKKCPPYLLAYLNAILGMILPLNLFVGTMYTISKDTKKIIFTLKSGLGFPNNILLDPILLMMPPFCGNEYLEWIMHSKSDLVMIVVYLL